MAVAPVDPGLNGRCAVTDDPSKDDESAEPKADPLRLVLHTMEEQLDDRVDEVGDAGPSHDESTAGLIRLEETLSSAQDKAKQLVTLRLKLDEEASTGGDGDAPLAGAPPQDEPTAGQGPASPDRSAPS